MQLYLIKLGISLKICVNFINDTGYWTKFDPLTKKIGQNDFLWHLVPFNIQSFPNTQQILEYLQLKTDEAYIHKWGVCG